ncbi:hypothetical protein ACROYT_G022433 [Oculina patagonica]
MNGENGLAEKRYTAQDIESIIYQQAVMKKVQDKIERDVQSSPVSEKLLVATQPQIDGDTKKQLTKREKLLVCFIAFLLSMFVLLAVVFGFLYAQQAEQVHLNSQIKAGQSVTSYPCVTKDCVLTSTDLLNYLDPKTDPCENFYEYVCGGWIRKNPLPNQKEEWNQFTKIEEESNQFIRKILQSRETQAEYSKLAAFQKGIAYYKSCVNTDEINRRGSKPLDDLIKEYGSWTITSDDWNEESWDMLKYISLMRRKLALGPLFTVFVSADQRNSSINTVQIRPIALLGLSRNRLTSNTTDGRKARRVYKEFIFNLTQALGAKNDSYSDMMDVIDFEIKLAQVMPTGRQAYDDENLYRKLTVKELNEYAGSDQMNWKEYLEQLLFPVTGIHVTDEEHVVVYGVDYLKNITNLLKETSNRTIANYMMWRLVDSTYLRLGEEFEEIFKNFYISLDDYWVTIPRDELCLQLMKEKYFATPLSRIYVDKLFNGDSKKIAKELTDDIREAFEQNILELDWMDDKTKSVAIRKVRSMVENIGFPDYIVDDKMIDEKYKNVVCNQSTYFENELSLDQATTERELVVFGKPVDDTEWALSPISVNAYYDMLANKMVFPAAILQSPFYNKRYPRAVLYGGVGAIMGHELTHGFDVDGRRFDMKGNERNWWSEETLEAFERKTKCLKEQYSNFTFDGGTIDGEQTLSENIADNGGIKQAFRAYQNWIAMHGEEARLPGMNLTNEQIFFISFARSWCSVYSIQGEEFALMSEHSPAPWRAKASVMNFPEFAKAFNCRLGSPMNPVNKCAVW